MSELRTEEETVEAIKKWWRDYGTSVVVGLLIGVAVVVGVRYWWHYQAQQAEAASVLFVDIEKALSAGNKDEVQKKGAQLQADYPKTSYAALGTLAMAKVNVDANDLDAAAKHLEWVVANAGEEAIKHVARVRLARVYLAQEKFDMTLALIESYQQGEFAAQYAELRGDAYLAQKKNEQARAAYEQAVKLTGTDPQQNRYLLMKLDDLAVASGASK